MYEEIPKGIYCYEIISISDWKIETKVCPYFTREHNNAFCLLTKKSDAILLNDQCKICGINEDF